MSNTSKAHGSKWATMNLRHDFRRSIIRLCNDYKASVRIVYLESDLQMLTQRNHSRDQPVADSAYDMLLDRWELPTALESLKLEIVAS